MAKKEVKARKSDDSKLFAFLAIFLSIVGFIIALLAKRDNKYVMHYAKQSLVLFIAWIILSVASWILFFIPLLGWFVSVAAWIAFVIFWIMGLIYSLSGEMKDIPVIGVYARKINL